MSDTASLTSSLVSGSISFTGLGSDTDFDEVIEALMEIESIQLERMETWKAEWEEKLECISDLLDRLDAIDEAAAELDTYSEFISLLATSSDEGVLTATADSDAIEGAYSITVGEDIQHIIRGAGVADDTTAVTDADGGDLVITVNGTTHTISLGANATINEVADAINTYFGAEGDVTASVEDDGSDSNPLRLQLISNVGGSAGEIIVEQSSLLFSLDSSDVTLSESWGGTSTSTATASGLFTGDSANTLGGQGYYEYEITMSEVSDVTVGTDSFTLDWSVTTESGVVTGSVTVDADYEAGDNIYIDEGIYLQLGEGTIQSGDTITLTAYANDIDDAEWSTQTGTSDVTMSGNYLGSVNNTYNFTVMEDGTLDDDSETSDSVTLRWVDSNGDTGTIEVTNSGEAFELAEGVYLTFSAGTLVDGDEFSVDLFAPDVQQAQDSGLAQTCKVVHSGMADADYTAVTAEGDGDKTFTYVYAGEEINVTVNEGCSLNELAALINSDENNPGVTATVVNDGLGLTNSYHLVLTGDDTGADNQISYISTDFTGGTFDSSSGEVGGGFSVTQQATNSMIKLDGFPEDELYMQRDSNTITDALTGVTMTLADTGTTNLTVSPDTEAISDKVEAFVEAVNYALEYIDEATAYVESSDDDDDASGVMIGNYAFQIIESRIKDIMSSAIDGLSADSGYTTLGSVGIESDPDEDGLYTFDSDTFIEALNDNLEAVADLFIENEDTGTTGAAYLMFEEMESQLDTEEGMLNVLDSNYDEIIENIDARIEREEYRLELVQSRLQTKFDNLETLLSELNNTSSAIESAIESLPSIGD